MAKTESFDITTGCDLQEVDNALNQARREITGRFDFKGVLAEIEADPAAGVITVHTTDRYKLDAIWDVMRGRLVARKVPALPPRRGVRSGRAGRRRTAEKTPPVTVQRPKSTVVVAPAVTVAPAIGANTSVSSPSGWSASASQVNATV